MSGKEDMKMVLNSAYGLFYADTDSSQDIPALDVNIRLHKGGIMPEKLSVGDWIDLAIPENIYLVKDNPIKIDLKFSCKLPENYEAHILPRSSTFERYGIILTNGMGIIDNSYSGDNDTWKALVYPFRDVYIERGTRLFQFRIVEKQPNIRLNRVEKLDDKDRGGYGSTGI